MTAPNPNAPAQQQGAAVETRIPPQARQTAEALGATIAGHAPQGATRATDVGMVVGPAPTAGSRQAAVGAGMGRQ